MASHTPGPWKVKQVHGEARKLSIYQLDGIIVTGVAYAEMYGEQKDRGETWRANVQLMGAAPDLLDALKEFAAQHTCGCKHPSCKSCDRDRMAAEVIAKAEGRES